MHQEDHIAQGPLSAHARGTLAFRVVIREDLDGKGFISRYIVHTQALSDNGDTFSYSDGQYFLVDSYVGDREAQIGAAWAAASLAFAARIRRQIEHQSYPATFHERCQMDTEAREYGRKGE
jgi:hypothetical protein